MPNDVESALRKVAAKRFRGGKGKKVNSALAKSRSKFVYSTMTNMQKKGDIPPWRKMNKGPSA